MKGFLGVAVLLAAAVAAVQSQLRVPPSRIVGGESTTIDNYPSMVQVDFWDIFTSTWGHNCAGNMLTSRWMLTAAHCFEGWFYDPIYRRIRAGTTFRNQGGSIYGIIREHNHPSYGTLGYDGDITMVEMADAVIWNPSVQPGTIIASGSHIPDNSEVIYAGWGRMYSGGPLPVDLQHVFLYTINNRICTDLYNKLNWLEGYNYAVTENMICTGYPGRDACQGDSGGPLYYDNIIVGVVSWGHGCANETYPGVSTAVSPYTEWIVRLVQ